VADSSTNSMAKKSIKVAVTIKPGLTAEGPEAFAEAAEKDALSVPLRLVFILLSLTTLMSCQAAPSRQSASPGPVAAGALTKEYQESTTDARRKYDGREITVKGLTQMAAMMPPPGEEQGLVFLEEKGANPPRRVACWFSKDQAQQFAKVTSGQYITVKGIFNGESGVELKFCKLVNIE